MDLDGTQKRPDPATRPHEIRASRHRHYTERLIIVTVQNATNAATLRMLGFPKSAYHLCLSYCTLVLLRHLRSVVQMFLWGEEQETLSEGKQQAGFVLMGIYIICAPSFEEMRFKLPNFFFLFLCGIKKEPLRALGF